MRAMLVLVVGMGVLIVAGVAVVAVTIVSRMGGHGTIPAAVALAEPAGTHIAGIAAMGDRLAVLLQGGGPDRVVVVDGRGGVRLAPASAAAR